MKILLYSLLFTAAFQLAAIAQDSVKFKFVDGQSLGVAGRGFSSSKNYHRLDSVDRHSLPKRVNELSRNSAGLSINFETNARVIKANWTLAKSMQLWNMTPVAVNGLDLYALNNNRWQYVASGQPKGDKNSAVLIENLDGKLRQYRLYLPLYSELTSIEIGVPDTAILRAANKAFNSTKKVVIYGSSITQGASASRPGLAYPSIISRETGIEIINLGFSGSGKMEGEVVDVLARIPADVYILDCVPNPSPDQLRERAYSFISRLRKLKPNVPVIMVESIYRETAHWNSQVRKRVEGQNQEFNKVYKKLHAENSKNLYYIKSEELLGNDHDATVDGTHLTDVGFRRLAERIMKTLRKAL